MSQPPGAAVSLRSSISEEMYERPASGRQRQWLPWAGADLAVGPARRKRTNGRSSTSASGGGWKAGEIRELHYENGLSLKELIAEGQRRLDAGLPGWKANYARSVLSKSR